MNNLKNQLIRFSEEFSFSKESLDNNTGRLDVRGVAITVGTTLNNVRYPAGELQKAAESFHHVPILKDHIATTDSTVGLVTKSQFANDELSYEGFLTSSDAIKLVRDGVIRHVSVGCMVKDLTEDANHKGVLVASGIKILELSLVPVPGCSAASIMAQNNFAAALHESWDIAQAQSTKDENNQEDVSMAEDYVLQQENGSYDLYQDNKFVRNLPVRGDNSAPKGKVSTSEAAFGGCVVERAGDGSLMFYRG
jgi:hypothetical protein